MIVAIGFLLVANVASAVLNIAVLDDVQNTVAGTFNLIVACCLAAALAVEITS